MRIFYFGSRLLLMTVTVAFGCSKAGNQGHQPAGGDLGNTPSSGNDLAVSPFDAGASSLSGPLTITPLDSTVTVVGGQATMPVQFLAFVGGVQTGAAWSIDRPELGAITSSGIFTPSGTLAGTANVSAVYGAQKATTSITVTMAVTQLGDPNAANPPMVGLGGYGGVGGDGPGPVPTAGQIGTLNGTPSDDPAVGAALSVRRHGLAARSPGAAVCSGTPGTHSFDSVVCPHQGDELRIQRILRGQQDAAS